MRNQLSTRQQQQPHIPLFEWYMPTHEHHYRFPFHFIRIFTPPELRVKWGKNHDEHTIVDWGELFYDLFFVAVSDASFGCVCACEELVRAYVYLERLLSCGG